MVISVIVKLTLFLQEYTSQKTGMWRGMKGFICLGGTFLVPRMNANSNSRKIFGILGVFFFLSKEFAIICTVGRGPHRLGGKENWSYNCGKHCGNGLKGQPAIIRMYR